MQLAPIQLEDLTVPRSNESELTRDSFLETISFIIVGYFCVSTEIRFIIQLKEEQKQGIAQTSQIPEGFDNDKK